MNLNNPIFVLYINVDGLGRQRAEEMLAEYAQNIATSPNINCWVFGVKNQQETKLEIIWKGAAIEAGNPPNQQYHNNLQNVMTVFNNINQNPGHINFHNNRDNAVLDNIRERRETRPELEPEYLTAFERNELALLPESYTIDK